MKYLTEEKLKDFRNKFGDLFHYPNMAQWIENEIEEAVQAIQMQAVVKHEIAELTDKENENYIDHYIDMGHFADPIKARPYLLDGFYHGYNYLKKKIEKQFSV